MYYFYKKLTLTAKWKKKKKWKEDFKGLIFLIAYFGTGTFIVKTQQTDKEG